MRIQDYRDVRGRFDGVASIEMFEAVGERWWPAYFRAVRDALAPGRPRLHPDDHDRRRALSRATATQSDFIQQYIFPGGMLASPSRLVADARAAGLELVRRARRSAATTRRRCKRWLAAFDAHVDAIRAQGFDERFIRCWRFYLAYCAAGFATGTTDVAHYTLVAR